MGAARTGQFSTLLLQRCCCYCRRRRCCYQKWQRPQLFHNCSCTALPTLRLFGIKVATQVVDYSLINAEEGGEFRRCIFRLFAAPPVYAPCRGGCCQQCLYLKTTVCFFVSNCIVCIKRQSQSQLIARSAVITSVMAVLLCRERRGELFLSGARHDRGHATHYIDKKICRSLFLFFFGLFQWCTPICSFLLERSSGLFSLWKFTHKRIAHCISSTFQWKFSNWITLVVFVSVLEKKIGLTFDRGESDHLRCPACTLLSVATVYETV